VDFSAYPISNGIAKDFITSCYSCSKHRHLFEYEDPTLGRARSPASERSTAIPIQMMCRTEEIVDGDEPSSYPWPPVARRAMNNSQGHASIPHRCGIPIVGYWRITWTRNHKIFSKSELLYPNAPLPRGGTGGARGGIHTKRKSCFTE